MVNVLLPIGWVGLGWVSRARRIPLMEIPLYAFMSVSLQRLVYIDIPNRYTKCTFDTNVIQFLMIGK